MWDYRYRGVYRYSVDIDTVVDTGVIDTVVVIVIDKKENIEEK